ncbi:uncharacterized protein LOC125238596 [Leguminivora glycinivorella]|uniref:uncharacterized protein LOC125238596 n=1 Tax=Leguminivora glycinivorella TaxID=1035111 RepID=UPI00200C50A4|nr:uncharacterized protein LOC125238596 [Leguminivora glycinivorella]
MSSDSDTDVSDCEPLTINTINTDLLPLKSKDRYIYAYENFISWQKDKNANSFSEDTILSYFQDMSRKYKPSTLWAMYSMLKCGLKSNNDVCMENYRRVRALLRDLNKGYVSKKVKTLSIEHAEQFIAEAPDGKYLATKVALIFGITGGLRRQELSLLTIHDIENHGKIFIVKIPQSKNPLQDSFVIQGKYYKLVKKYQKLRVTSAPSDRFFQAYRDGKCRAQVIGRNKFGSMPKEIAEFLKLPDARSYTGHTLRAVSRMPVALERCGSQSFTNDSNSTPQTLKVTEPKPQEHREQCRFCGEFKKCSPVVQKPYIIGNKTTLALNHLRVELDLSIDSLPKTVCRECDAKLLEIFEFIKLVNSAQFSLVTVSPNDATSADSSAQSENYQIEFDTQIVKSEFEEDESFGNGVDSLSFCETVYLKDRKRKHEDKKTKKKRVKRDKIVENNYNVIVDVKEETIDDIGNSEDNFEVSDTGTGVETSELAEDSVLDYEKGTFSDMARKKSNDEEYSDTGDTND